MRRDELQRVVAEDAEAVLVYVAEARGSAPRDVGAAMAVTRTDAVGTVGGGSVEAEAIATARAMLTAETRFHTERFALGPEIDQCCGGAMTLLYRRINGGDVKAGRIELAPGGPVFEPRPRRALYLYGAGHVGRAVARAAEPLDFSIIWTDPRPDAFVGVESPAEKIVTPLPEALAKDAPADALHLVFTHSHAVDLEIVSAILGRGAFGFCGLIGSATKRALFQRRLRERGVAAANLARLTCPIGALPIKDKRPAAIAASVAAQLLIVESEIEAATADLTVSGGER